MKMMRIELKGIRAAFAQSVLGPIFLALTESPGVGPGPKPTRARYTRVHSDSWPEAHSDSLYTRLLPGAEASGDGRSREAFPIPECRVAGSSSGPPSIL